MLLVVGHRFKLAVAFTCGELDTATSNESDGIRAQHVSSSSHGVQGMHYYSECRLFQSALYVVDYCIPLDGLGQRNLIRRLVLGVFFDCVGVVPV
jgi:hypothetical protein